MATRPIIPQDIVDHLMLINRHTCCICHISRKHVQVHHIDGDSSSNSIENLAVLCLDCHSIVTGDEGLGRRYSQGEVSHYKKDWESQCIVNESSGDNDEEQEPIDSHYENSVLGADSHLAIDYDLEEDNEMSIWAASDCPIHIAIMKQKDYQRWLKTDEITYYEEFHDNQLELETCFTIPQDDHYSVVVINDSDEDVEIQLDISIR